jgi:methylated-DNA-[protein]-cysteine S-methyltransferase
MRTASPAPALRRLPPEVTPVAWTDLATPLGPLYLAASPEGLLAVGALEADAAAFTGRLEDSLGARYELSRGAAPMLDWAVAELEAYFAGAGRDFTVPLDRRLMRGAFTAQALEALRGVPWGHLVSYSELGRRCGAPRAARAVGHACATNPLSIVIPCHRVVHANGGIGGYGGASRGIAYKRALLAIEGVVFPTPR